MQSGEIADLLGKSKNTIINWTRDFGDFLSHEAGGKPKGSRREFTEADLFVLATIKEQYEIGLTTEEVERVLKRNYRVTRLPEKPDPAIEAAKDRIELVPTQEVTRWMDQVKSLEIQLNQALTLHREEVQRIANERDEARSETKAEIEKRIDAEKRASAMEGEIKRLADMEHTIDQLRAEVQDKTLLAMRLQPLIGQVEELQNQLGYQQWLLEEEKKRKRGLFG